MELHEARPCLVEHDVIAEMPDALDDALGVDDRAVVGALLHHRGAERTLALPSVGNLDQRIVADALAQGGFVERVGPDRADQAVRIAIGRHEDGNTAGQQQRAVMGRLVVVAVEQHDVVLGDEIVQDNLVRGGGAVEDEVGLLRTEDGGGLLLRLQGRALVREQVAQLEHRIVEIVAENRVAEMFDEDPSDRAAVVENAAVVAGAGPKLVAFLGIVDEGPKNGVLSVSAYCLRRETRFLAMNSGVSSARKT